MTDLFPPQKSFADFTRERHGDNCVYFARRTPRIVARYGADVVVITPAMARSLKRDYQAIWGREAWPHDDAHWKALCALKALPADAVDEKTLALVDAAIDALTGG